MLTTCIANGQCREHSITFCGCVHAFFWSLIFFMILTIFSSLSWLAFSASFPFKVKKTTNYKLNLQQQKIQRNILTLAY